MSRFNSLIINVYCSMLAWSSLLALILKLWGPSVLHFGSFGVHFVSFGVSKAPFCEFGGPFWELWGLVALGFHWATIRGPARPRLIFSQFWLPFGVHSGSILAQETVKKSSHFFDQLFD